MYSIFNRTLVIPHDEEIYKWRHLIENYFSKIKEFIPIRHL